MLLPQAEQSTIITGNVVQEVVNEDLYMTANEKRLDELENRFPSLSGSAFSRAYQQTLDSGLSVLVSDGGYLYEVFPDGTRKKIKKIEPPTAVERGKKIAIR